MGVGVAGMGVGVAGMGVGVKVGVGVGGAFQSGSNSGVGARGPRMLFWGTRVAVGLAVDAASDAD
jgi:hypothetical protein